MSRMSIRKLGRNNLDGVKKRSRLNYKLHQTKIKCQDVTDKISKKYYIVYLNLFFQAVAALVFIRLNLLYFSKNLVPINQLKIIVITLALSIKNPFLDAQTCIYLFAAMYPTEFT